MSSLTNIHTAITSSSSSSAHTINRPNNFQPIVIKRNQTNNNTTFSTLSNSNDTTSLLSPSVGLNVNECKDLFVQQKETVGVDDSKATMKSHFQKIGTFVIFDSLLVKPKPNKPAITQTHSLPTTLTTTTATTGPVQSQTSTTGHQDLSFNTAFNLIDNKSYYWKKFSKHDYVDKLRPYYIMNHNESIYKFSEIIIGNSDVYAFYESHHGDLHNYMKEKKKLKESEAKQIFHQIVNIIKDCHDNGIIVRDIKLKKFVFANAQKTKVLLTGLEDCLILENESDDQIKSQQGCPAYVSPEVLNSHQSMYSGKLSDSWSLGIILYTLLFGRYPFHHNQITTMFSKITKGKFQIPLIGISLNAKILLRSLIRLKPTERLLPNEILFCNWFKDMPAVHPDPNVIMSLMKKSASTYSAYNNDSFVANQFSNLQSISRPSNTDMDLGDNQYVPVIK